MPMYPTYGVKPENKIQKKSVKRESPNIVLIKKLQENNPKQYKFIFIDATVCQDEQDYKDKI